MGTDQSRKLKQIFVKDIENGMTIGKDIFDSAGGLLLAKDFEIREAYKIKRLLGQHSILLITIIEEPQRPAEIVRIPMVEVKEPEVSPTVLKSIHAFHESREKIIKSFDKLINGEDIQREEIEKNIQDALKLLNGSTNVFQIMQSVKNLDDATYAHCQNVSLISYTIGQWLNLSELDLQELALAGMLIDLGKSKIDIRILNKKQHLTNDEYAELKKHAIYSYQLIKDYDFISDRVKKAVFHHHERFDGSGYPLSLAGERIPLFSRIIAIADVYNALISERPYRDKKTPFEAIRILETEFMSRMDPSILYLFLKKIVGNYMGQVVKLNNNAKGEIIFIPSHHLHRPVIRLFNEEIVDLSDKKNEYLDIIEFCNVAL